MEGRCEQPHRKEVCTQFQGPHCDGIPDSSIRSDFALDTADHSLLTIPAGAFVAGLDAGLLYNEFPLMGGRLAPPADELFSAAYAKKEDGSDVWWRNIFENPTTVQFNHRCLVSNFRQSLPIRCLTTYDPPGNHHLCMHSFALRFRAQPRRSCCSTTHDTTDVDIGVRNG